jgi:ECF transporter S component (folate family)
MYKNITLEKSSMLKSTFTTKKVVLMGLLVSMSAALTPLVVYIGPQQRVGNFNLIPLAIGAVLLGPVAALLMGFAADTINYLIRPVGVYFPGFALSLMLACLSYSLWQYNRPLRLWRIVCAQACNVVFIYFGLNHIWRVILLGPAGATFFTSARLISNSIMLPIIAFTVYGLCGNVLALQEQRHKS